MNKQAGLSLPVLAGLLLLAALLGGGVAVAITQAAGLGRQDAGDVRGYLLANPEIIPEAMETLRTKETRAKVAASEPEIFEPFGSAWQGDAEGVPVAVYMDYACGYCRASLEEIERLVASDTKVRVVYRELPILSEASRTAAQWSLAAAEQGKFQRFHDTLFAGGQLSDAAIEQAAKAAGLDMARAAQVAASPEIAAHLQQNMEVAGKLGMTGTPSWVIGDQVISGAIPYEQLSELVAAAAKQG